MRARWRWLALVVVPWMSLHGAQACTSPGGTSPGDGIGGTEGDAGRDQMTVDVNAGGEGGTNGGGELNPLCGEPLPDDCVPDLASGCGTAPGPEPSGAGGAGGAAGEGGGGGAGPVGDGGTDEITLACQVIRDDSTVGRRCMPSGASAVDGPCLSSRDCAPGLACIREGSAGRCRPYCCAGDDEVCSPGLVCSEREVRGVNLDEPLLVPACVRADNCSLAAPYPCDGADNCQCPEGKACTVVRPDGTTNCEVPGDGEAGEPCPCAAGYICSQGSGTCLKLCSTAPSNDEGACGSGICQDSANLPEGWGVCVGD